MQNKLEGRVSAQLHMLFLVISLRASFAFTSSFLISSVCLSSHLPNAIFPFLVSIVFLYPSELFLRRSLHNLISMQGSTCCKGFLLFSVELQTLSTSRLSTLGATLDKCCLWTSLSRSYLIWTSAMVMIASGKLSALWPRYKPSRLCGAASTVGTWLSLLWGCFSSLVCCSVCSQTSD